MGIVVLAEDDDSYQPTIAAKIAEGYLPPKEVSLGLVCARGRSTVAGHLGSRHLCTLAFSG